MGWKQTMASTIMAMIMTTKMTMAYTSALFYANTHVIEYIGLHSHRWAYASWWKFNRKVEKQCNSHDTINLYHNYNITSVDSPTLSKLGPLPFIILINWYLYTVKDQTSGGYDSLINFLIQSKGESSLKWGWRNGIHFKIQNIIYIYITKKY